jgi:hypothetical protein
MRFALYAGFDCHIEVKKKKAPHPGGAFLGVTLDCLLRDYVGRTRAFFALSDIKLNLLAFLKIGIAGRLDFGVVYEQILAAVVGSDKSKALLSIKPFYSTCAHSTLLLWPFKGP